MSKDDLIAELRQQATELQTEIQRRPEKELALEQRERELSDFVDDAVEGLHKVDRNGIILRGDTKAAHERGIIERQVKHMVRLVDDLLDVSRITRGESS